MKMEKGIVGAALVSCAVVSGACRVMAAPNESASALARSSELTHGSALPPGLVPSLITPSAPLPALDTATYNYYYIKLKNVAPDLMAWWIDPAHNVEPELVTQSQRLWEASQSVVGQPHDLVRKSGDREKVNRGPLALPAGVEVLVPVSAQKALLGRATAEGLEKLEKIVEFLDVPLRQVEVEADFVAVSRDDAKAFGLDWSDVSAPTTTGMKHPLSKPQFGLGFMRHNYRSTLNDLIKQGKAHLVSRPHFIVTNNLTVSATTDTHFADAKIEANAKAMPFTDNPAATSPPAASSFFLVTRYKLTLSATVNNDDTLTLHLAPLVGSVLTSAAANGELPVTGSQWVNTTIIVHEGDTLAVSGLSLVGNEIATSDPQMMIFITSRIIRPVANQDTAQTKTVQPKPVQP